MDDWDPEAMPAAVTDPDVREAADKGQEEHRRRRLDHMATVEANRASPLADPARQGAFDQKPDIQQQQIELWAHKWLAYLEQNDPGLDVAGIESTWLRFVRQNELPQVWADTLVLPRAQELGARRLEPGVHPGLFESTEEVQLEGGAGPQPPVPPEIDTGRPDERGPSGNDSTVGNTGTLLPIAQARAALDTYLGRIASGEITGEQAMLERLERLAGL